MVLNLFHKIIKLLALMHNNSWIQMLNIVDIYFLNIKINMESWKEKENIFLNKINIFNYVKFIFFRLKKTYFLF